MITTNYVIRGGEQGRARLRILARALRHETLSLLSRVGTGPGMACLDVGCGGGDVTLEMARLVGPSGAVAGIDVDGVKLRLAREEAERESLSHVKFLELGAEQLDHEAEYDLVYARFLLTHLSDPAGALRRMVRAARPGGVVVVEDIDHSAVFSYPACPALSRYVCSFNQVMRLNGGDPEIGPKLPALFRRAGLLDVHLCHVQPAFIEGEAKRLHQITLENVAPTLIAAGLASETEIEDLSVELDEFAADPETIIGGPRIFQVWAYRK